jgi:F-type H+-transporting ATPase subunit gamma
MSIHDLKKRIQSVRNTQQTTRAMKMVSAAKLRRAQDMILNHRPYAGGLVDLLGTLSQEGSPDALEPYIHSPGAAKGAPVLWVGMSSDRGLCGGFNAVVLSRLDHILAKDPQAKVMTLGKKLTEMFSKRPAFAGTFGEFSGPVQFERAKGIRDQLLKLFRQGEYASIHFCSNQFVNAVTTQVECQTFLPLGHHKAAAKPRDEGVRLMKPHADQVLAALVEKTLTIQVYRCLLESQAAEHAARMSAMENAHKNAKDMIRSLTLKFNKQRQAAITKELLEIIAGSESQKRA